MLMRKSVTDGFVCERDLRGGGCTQATLLRTAHLIEDKWNQCTRALKTKRAILSRISQRVLEFG